MSRRSRCHRRVVGGAAAILGAVALVWSGASAFGAPRSSPAGVALIASVDDAYTHVPAVIIAVGGVGPADGRFTQVLKNGSIVAEAYTRSNSTGTTVLVAPKGPQTYAMEPHTACWRTLPRSDPQTLADVGHPFLNVPGETIGTPRATVDGWTVTVMSSGTTAVITIDKSRLVRSIAATESGLRAREAVTNLTRTPILPDPTPRC